MQPAPTAPLLSKRFKDKACEVFTVGSLVNLNDQLQKQA